MGKVNKGVRCDARGCDKPAIRSFPLQRAKEADIDIASAQRRIYLCDDHYKVMKKARRKEERLERWRWTA